MQPRIKRGHFLKVYRRVAASHVLVTKASVQKIFVKTGTASQRSSVMTLLGVGEALVRLGGCVGHPWGARQRAAGGPHLTQHAEGVRVEVPAGLRSGGHRHGWKLPSTWAGSYGFFIHRQGQGEAPRLLPLAVFSQMKLEAKALQVNLFKGTMIQ